MCLNDSLTLDNCASAQCGMRALALQLLIGPSLAEKAHTLATLAPQQLQVDVQARWPEPAGLPARPVRPELVAPAALSQRAVGTPEGHASLIHALAHIEANAINLALDAVWRFANMPQEFYRDWWCVAQEEARHFSMLQAHLTTLGYAYGDFAAHDGLWDMAKRTRDDVLARMALVPRTLEARGLDATPPIQKKLVSIGDLAGARLLDTILQDEIGHVQIGNRWYRWICAQRGLNPHSTDALLAHRYTAPAPKGPCNFAARRAAGFDEYELAHLCHATLRKGPPP